MQSIGSSGGFTLADSDNITISGSGSTLNILTHPSSNTTLNGDLFISDNGLLSITSNTVFLGSSTILNGGTEPGKGTLDVTGNLSISGTTGIANLPNIALSGDGDYQITAPASGTSIENIGQITKTGTGTTTIDTNINNIGAQVINLQAGTLLLADSDQIANATNMVLDGGTFATGGNDEILGSLTLASDSIINLGSGDSILVFEGLSSTYTSGLLTIENWNGNPDGGGDDQIIFGTTLTQSFLNNIYWGPAHPTGAIQLASGEIVPIPEPTTIFASLLLLLAAFTHFLRQKRSPSHQE